MEDKISSDAIIQYQKFVTNVLQPNLLVIEDDLALAKQTRDGCAALLSLLNQGSTELQTRVDVGQRCFVEAKLNVERLNMEMGVLGMYVSMTKVEAIPFLERRLEILSQ